MKWKVFLVSVFFISNLNVFAQDFQGGILGGLNAARIDGDGHERYGKIGLNAGFFVARPTQIENLLWQLEVKYTSRGSYHNYYAYDGTLIGWELIDLKFLELPASLHYNFLEKMQVAFGFSLDFLLKDTYATHDINRTDLPEDLRPVGLTAFIGYNYFILDRLSLGFRFNYSVFPFYKFDAYAVRYRDSGWFHDVLSVNLKYYLLQ